MKCDEAMGGEETDSMALRYSSSPSDSGCRLLAQIISGITPR